MKLSLRKKCPYSELFWTHFPAFGLNTERYGVSIRIRSECGKMWTRTTPNTEILQADDRNPAWIDEKIKKIVLQKNRAYSTYS